MANPACMNMTRKPQTSVQTIFIAILLWPIVSASFAASGSFGPRFFQIIRCRSTGACAHYICGTAAIRTRWIRFEFRSRCRCCRSRWRSQASLPSGQEQPVHLPLEKQVLGAAWSSANKRPAESINTIKNPMPNNRFISLSPYSFQSFTRYT